MHYDHEKFNNRKMRNVIHKISHKLSHKMKVSKVSYISFQDFLFSSRKKLKMNYHLWLLYILIILRKMKPFEKLLCFSCIFISLNIIILWKEFMFNTFFSTVWCHYLVERIDLPAICHLKEIHMNLSLIYLFLCQFLRLQWEAALIYNVSVCKNKSQGWE